MNIFKKSFFVLILSVLLSTSLSFADNNIKLIPIGQVIYIHTYLKYPVVESILDDSAKSLKTDDVLLSITSKYRGKITDLDDMCNLMKIKDDTLEVEFLRNNKAKSTSITSDELRLYKLTSISGGIGTVTAVNEKGEFIGLAHELKAVKNNSGFNKIKIFETEFIQQKKSYKDNIGCLIANTNGNLLGEITSVDKFGVKGKYNDFKFDKKEALSIAKPQLGRAYILCSDPITNELKLHEIEITEVGDQLSAIKVVDDSLIKFRGGIVKGMSGSPVIQDNKIIGGVRSTKVSDPKEGHISNIDDMLGIELD